MNHPNYFEAPNVPSFNTDFTPTVFLAGSITGANDWQKEAAEDLLKKGLIVFNPRRSNFDVSDKKMEREQIEWEYRQLRNVDLIIFYFSWETVAPITLYELGRAIMENKVILIAIHPEYPRKNDVLIQTELDGFPRDRIFNSLQEMLAAINITHEN